MSHSEDMEKETLAARLLTWLAQKLWFVWCFLP
jgi:hypothetical protein